MSRQIGKIGDLTVTQFYAGDRNGLSLQLTPDTHCKYSILTIKQTRELAKLLQDWLAERELPFGRPSIDAIPDKLIEQAKNELIWDGSRDALHTLLHTIEKLKE